VAELYQRAFRQTDAPASAAVREAFHDLFVAGPLAAPDRPSLVRVDAGGRVTGFVGALTRPFRFQGKPVRGVAASQLMVDPSAGGSALAGLDLISALVSGPQDFTFSDGTSEVAARMWQRRDGVAVAFYSAEWTRILRPAGYLSGRLKPSSRLGRVARGAGPLLRVGDRLASALGASRFTPGPGPLQDRDASPDEYLACLSWPGPEALRALPDARTFAWLIAHARQTRRLGDLRLRLVTDGARVVGGYCQFVAPGATSQVLHLAAISRPLAPAVLQRAWWDAWQGGAVAVSGQLDERFRSAIQHGLALVELAGVSFVAHARDPGIVAALQAGDSTISRLDGEWWTRLGIDRTLEW
jgi:hypothetical protein